jgi:hypothetical protein
MLIKHLSTQRAIPTQENTYVHDLSEIRTHNPTVEAIQHGMDLRLLGYCEQGRGRRSKFLRNVGNHLADYIDHNPDHLHRRENLNLTQRFISFYFLNCEGYVALTGRMIMKDELRYCRKYSCLDTFPAYLKTQRKTSVQQFI